MESDIRSKLQAAINSITNEETLNCLYAFVMRIIENTKN